MTRGVVDKVNVAADDKSDTRYLCWKDLGEAVLAKGRHTIRFRMSSADHHHGALDAFVLTTRPFKPSGSLRPGEATGLAGSGAGGEVSIVAGAKTWPFLPPRDTFPADAVLDLRDLNEKVAGQSGFVRLSPDGESFVLGDGSPARFWAINSDLARYRNDPDLAHGASFPGEARGEHDPGLDPGLSQGGQGSIPEGRPQGTGADLEARRRRQEGRDLHDAQSLLVGDPVPGTRLVGDRGLAGEGAPFGLLFFNPRLQEGFKSWLKELFTTPNPYTGIPLAKDPALAIFQTQNEDSLLFWTIQSLKGRQLEYLGTRFGEWLTQKYGSLDQAFKAWNGDSMKEDDPARGVVGIHIVWEFTQARQGGRKKRLDDQLQFYAETMFRFNQEIGRYLREDLGCRCSSTPATGRRPTWSSSTTWSAGATRRTTCWPSTATTPRSISGPIAAGGSTRGTGSRTCRPCSLPARCR